MPATDVDVDSAQLKAENKHLGFRDSTPYSLSHQHAHTHIHTPASNQFTYIRIQDTAARFKKVADDVQSAALED